MLRKAFITAVLVGLTAVACASPASALTVENPGDNEITAEVTIGIGSFTPHPDFESALECYNHWSGSVSASGAVSLPNVDIVGHSGEIGDCVTADDCNHAGWDGTIIEPGPSAEFGIHFEFCINIFGNIPAEVTCNLANTEAHCNGPVFLHGTTTPIAWVLGEVSIEEPLGLMHD